MRRKHGEESHTIRDAINAETSHCNGPLLIVSVSDEHSQREDVVCTSRRSDRILFAGVRVNAAEHVSHGAATCVVAGQAQKRRGGSSDESGVLEDPGFGLVVRRARFGFGLDSSASSVAAFVEVGRSVKVAAASKGRVIGSPSAVKPVNCSIRCSAPVNNC